MANQPQHSQALAYLGDALLQLGDKTEAELNLRRALALDRNNRLAHLDLGILLSGAEAATHLREAIRLDPNKPDAHYRLGRLLLAEGRQQEADAEFAKVKQLAKDEKQQPLVNVSARPADPSQ